MIAPPPTPSMCLAVVVIGRNEGQRLQTCLTSAFASGIASVVVYVDSGSSDDSVSLAEKLGCQVVNLDLSTPFTAARGRNEGFTRAMQCVPGLTHVQFVDGDCELAKGWLENAVAFLQCHTDVAAVCGRRRERYPDRSVYNRLCDIEWDTPIGATQSCGGDVLMRADAFRTANGYRAGLIAGEEPELCVRLRSAGWKIWRTDEEMTLHDAAMLHFGQWWSRSKRAGHAFAEGAWLHGAPPERHWVKETISAFFWGITLPTTIFLLSIGLSLWCLVAFAIYPIQVARLTMRLGNPQRALFLVMGKFPEASGVLKFYIGKLRGSGTSIIEYK
jgi:GT2 family glycosyltransferase